MRKTTDMERRLVPLRDGLKALAHPIDPASLRDLLVTLLDVIIDPQPNSYMRTTSSHIGYVYELALALTRQAKGESHVSQIVTDQLDVACIALSKARGQLRLLEDQRGAD